MKAVIYTQYGTPDVLRYCDVPTPEPKPDEIRIKVMACEATKGDCELRSFNFPVKWFSLPLRLLLGIRKPRRTILGGYPAGIVDAVGSQVTRFKKGDAVFGSSGLRFGGYGEYLCVPESYTFVHKPESISFAQAAAVPLGGLNALHFMNLVDITPGQQVLINGAGGSIGSYALQIAKARGAHVTAVDAAHKETFLRELGADAFWDYRETPFYQREQQFDVILNMVAQGQFRQFIDRLTRTGCYLMANPRFSDMLRAFTVNKFTERKALFAFAGEKEAELQQLARLIEDGEIKPVLDQEITLADAADAHRRVETEQRLGAVVLVHSS